MLIFLASPFSVVALYLVAIFVYRFILPIRASFERKHLPLLTSIWVFLLGVYTCLYFDKATTGFQFPIEFNYVPEYNLALSFGVDGLSMVFLLLTLFTFPFLFLAAWKSEDHFWNYLIAMEILLVLAFSTTDILYFFIFFESLLIPMFIVIGVWGARARKIKAAYYFFLYTLFGSLFMLFGIFYLFFLTGSTDYTVLLNSNLSADQQAVVWFCFFIAFAVKMPLFPVHIWLLEAHVEAPTVGSMLLASLLLKLGGYAFLRFSVTFLASASHSYGAIIAVCALLGVVYGSLSTIRQIDLKRIIAYSSVAHMNLVMLGLFSWNQQGVEGATYLMVAHGVVSAALFFCVGVVYDRHHSRLLKYFSGLVTVMPLYAVMFTLFSLANMSFPGTANFVGELLIFTGLYQYSPTVMILATPCIVLGAAYSTWLLNRHIFGPVKTVYIAAFKDLDRREFYILSAFAIAMLLLGLVPNAILDFMHLPVGTIIA